MLMLNLRYYSWIITLTGKWDEWVQTESSTIGELILELDKKYSGFKDVFIPPEMGKLNIRTAINLIRAGQPGKGIIDPGEKLQDGDLLVFY